MGDRVLKQIIPILTHGLADERADTRQGVCYGLREVLDGVSRGQLAEHLGELLPAVQAALTDEDAGVRTAAAAAFGVLFKGGAGSAVDSIIPSLMLALEGGGKSAGQALEGLRVILGVKPGTINAMLPRLAKPPLSAGHVRALGELAEAAGPSTHPHVPNLLPPLLAAASDPAPGAEPLAAACGVALSQIALSVQEDGQHLLASALAKALDEPPRRRAAVALVASWAAKTQLDFQEHVPALLMVRARVGGGALGGRKGECIA